MDKSLRFILGLLFITAFAVIFFPIISTLEVMHQLLVIGIILVGFLMLFASVV
jgi:hypothetical protein